MPGLVLNLRLTLEVELNTILVAFVLKLRVCAVVEVKVATSIGFGVLDGGAVLKSQLNWKLHATVRR